MICTVVNTLHVIKSTSNLKYTLYMYSQNIITHPKTRIIKKHFQ